MGNNFATLSKGLKPYNKRRLLQFLMKHNLYAKYLEYFSEQISLSGEVNTDNFIRQFSSKYNSITYAFAWTMTKEGYHYWSEISDEYFIYITQPHSTRNKRFNIF